MILPYKDPEDAKKWAREYNKRPEVKERQKIAKKKYRNDPDVKKRYEPYFKEYREKNRNKIKKSAKNTRYEIKNDVLGHYSKKLSNSDVPCCNCCGEYEFLIFLTIDHITDRKNATHKKGLGGTKLYRYLQKNGYPSGYQVLCWNCNSAKSDSGMCPHKRSGV